METNFSITRKILAWAVHSFTASGLVAGFMAILAINTQDWRSAMLWLMACQLIDGVDGLFARAVGVKEVLPNVDGKTIDYVVDFVTYAIIPAYFFYQAELVAEDWRLPLTAVILIVSAVYYGKDGMVSDDMYFIGFPVMWNMVVFFMIFVFQFNELWNALFIIFFAILHFVPIKFVYPSQATRYRWLTLGLTIVFISNLVAILLLYPQRSVWLIGLAYLTVVGYAGLAVYNTWVENRR